jgi:hypothetical protein
MRLFLYSKGDKVQCFDWQKFKNSGGLSIDSLNSWINSDSQTVGQFFKYGEVFTVTTTLMAPDYQLLYDSSGSWIDSEYVTLITPLLIEINKIKLELNL